VVARIGTVFFVTVSGDIERRGQLLEINTITDLSWFERGPITLGLVFENTGSVHLSPYGTVRIKNFWGGEAGYVELEPWFALPQSQRFREVVWSSDFMFGRYTATADINRGYENNVDSLSVTFWVLPWKPLLATLVFLMTIIFLISLRFRRRK